MLYRLLLFSSLISLFSIFTFAFNGNSFAQEESYRLMMLPKEPFLNLPARYMTLANTTPIDASATINNFTNEPQVFFNPVLAHFVPRQVMGGMIQHEYCHHDLGHVRENVHSPWREADADCCAGYNLMRQNRKNALKIFINFLERQGCSYEAETAIAEISNNFTHPCPLQRARVLRFCASSDISKLSKKFIQEKLPSELDEIEL